MSYYNMLSKIKELIVKAKNGKLNPNEYNGGTIEENNLRPICEKCNLDMGTQNWNDYDN